MTVCQGVRVQPLRRRGLLSAFAPCPVSTPALREFRGMITECERLAEDESSSLPTLAHGVLSWVRPPGSADHPVRGELLRVQVHPDCGLWAAAARPGLSAGQPGFLASMRNRWAWATKGP